MKRLIRFEDKYGMPDIICPLQGLGLPNLENEKLTCATLKEDVMIQFGLSIGAVFYFDDVLKAEIYKNEIDELVYVYDMDAISGRGILSVEEITTKVAGISAALASMNRTVSVRFAPIVWAAETVMLYAFIKELDAAKVIHLKNTAKFQGYILNEILRHNGYPMQDIKLKHMREYQPTAADMADRLQAVIMNDTANINKAVIQWMLSSNSNYLFDCKSVITHQERIVRFYHQNKPKETDTFICYEKELGLNQRCW